jgi:hypothetical protein
VTTGHERGAMRQGQAGIEAGCGRAHRAAHHSVPTCRSLALDADAGQEGCLLASEALHAAVAAVSGQPGLLGVILARRELRNSRMSSLLATPSTLRACSRRWETPAVPLLLEVGLLEVELAPEPVHHLVADVALVAQPHDRSPLGLPESA